MARWLIWFGKGIVRRVLWRGDVAIVEEAGEFGRQGSVQRTHVAWWHVTGKQCECAIRRVRMVRSSGIGLGGWLK